MDFGAFVREGIASTVDAGASTLRDIGAAATSAVAKAADLAQRAAQAATNAAVATGRAVKDAAVAAGTAAKDAAIATGQAVKGAAITAGNATVDAGEFAARKTGAATVLAGDAALGASAIAVGATGYVAGQAYGKVKDTYDKVREKFSPQRPVTQPCQTCLAEDSAEARKARIEKRNELIAEGHLSRDPAARDAAEELRGDMKAVEMARLSENSYAQYRPGATDAEKKPPEPWKAMTMDEAKDQGIKVDSLKNAKAVIYTVPSDFPYEPKTVVAFRGTTGEAADIIADHDQALGLKHQQYEAARDLGEQLRKAMPDAEVTGHSLGGGKAQAAGVAGGLKGQMFNSAGLHPNSVGLPADGLAPYAGDFVQYRAAGGLAQGGGDPLTGLQNSPAAQQAAYRVTQGLQGFGRANQWALKEFGIDDPLAALPESSRQFAKDMADRILNITPQEAANNKEFSGGKWYVPPAIGEVRGLASKTAEGEDSGIAAQHSITNLVYGIESRKTQDITTLLKDTGRPGQATDYIGRIK